MNFKEIKIVAGESVGNLKVINYCRQYLLHGFKAIGCKIELSNKLPLLKDKFHTYCLLPIDVCIKNNKFRIYYDGGDNKEMMDNDKITANKKQDDQMQFKKVNNSDRKSSKAFFEDLNAKSGRSRRNDH